MLSFLSPLFLAGAAAAAIPIVLHLLKRNPEPRIRFAAVRFLRLAQAERTDRRNIRELLLLALRVSALVLLALAFARPFFASGAARVPASITIVALDTSSSLSAPGRFEHAREMAADVVRRAAAGDAVGVLTFADDATVALRPSLDREAARSALSRAAAGSGATRYRSALAAAADLLGGRRGTVVLVTDLQASGLGADERMSLPDSARLEIADVGELPPNLAITALKPASDRVVATIRNTGPAPRRSTVSLSVDDRAVGSPQPITVAADQSIDVTFAGVPSGAAVRAVVADETGLQADNVRFAVAGNAQPAVLVVTSTGDLGRDALYLQQALSSDADDAGGYRLDGVSADALNTLPAARLRPAAIVLLSTRGLDRRGRERVATYVKGGGGLFVAAGPDVDGQILADMLGAGITLAKAEPSERRIVRTLAPGDLRHPIFRAFGASASMIGLVSFTDAARISGSACQTLARFTTGEAALLDCQAGAGRVLLFASDLDKRWNEFPVHPTFVPFVHEAIRYVSTDSAGGEYLVAGVPAGVQPVPGIATVSGAAANAGGARRIAVNVDPRESEAGRLTPAQFQARIDHTGEVLANGGDDQAQQQEARQHLWEYAVVAMMLVIAIEGFVGARTA